MGTRLNHGNRYVVLLYVITPESIDYCSKTFAENVNLAIIMSLSQIARENRQLSILGLLASSFTSDLSIRHELNEIAGTEESETFALGHIIKWLEGKQWVIERIPPDETDPAEPRAPACRKASSSKKPSAAAVSVSNLPL